MRPVPPVPRGPRPPDNACVPPCCPEGRRPGALAPLAPFCTRPRAARRAPAPRRAPRPRSSECASARPNPQRLTCGPGRRGKTLALARLARCLAGRAAAADPAPRRARAPARSPLAEFHGRRRPARRWARRSASASAGGPPKPLLPEYRDVYPQPRSPARSLACSLAPAFAKPHGRRRRAGASRRALPPAATVRTSVRRSGPGRARPPGAARDRRARRSARARTNAHRQSPRGPRRPARAGGARPGPPGRLFRRRARRRRGPRLSRLNQPWIRGRGRARPPPPPSVCHPPCCAMPPARTMCRRPAAPPCRPRPGGGRPAPAPAFAYRLPRAARCAAGAPARLRFHRAAARLARRGALDASRPPSCRAASDHFIPGCLLEPWPFARFRVTVAPYSCHSAPASRVTQRPRPASLGTCVLRQRHSRQRRATGGGRLRAGGSG